MMKLVNGQVFGIAWFFSLLDLNGNHDYFSCMRNLKIKIVKI